MIIWLVVLIVVLIHNTSQVAVRISGAILVLAAESLLPPPSSSCNKHNDLFGTIICSVPQNTIRDDVLVCKSYVPKQLAATQRPSEVVVYSALIWQAT